MQEADIKVIFQINYFTVFGDNIAVIGNNSRLGAWNPFTGLNLIYQGVTYAYTYNFKDGNWSGSLTIPRTREKIEYKYVVINKEQNKAIWEEGDNRILDLNQSHNSKKDIIMIEVWNHREVQIRIRHDCPKGGYLSIVGDSCSLGNWNPVGMTLVKKKNPITKERTYYWQKSFFVRHDTKKLKYRFAYTDPENNDYLLERDPHRDCNFQTLSTTCNPKYLTSPNNKLCLKFYRKQNKFIKYDANFTAELEYTEINQKLIIGPYPQSTREIDALAKRGVKAVLNLQTKKDMTNRLVDWDELKEHYNERGIKVTNFSVTDVDVEDLIFKGHQGARKINELSQNYEKIYIHCTSGVWRAPHLTAFYMILYLRYSAEEAFRLIYEKRPFVRLKKEILEYFMTMSKRIVSN